MYARPVTTTEITQRPVDDAAAALRWSAGADPRRDLVADWRAMRSAHCHVDHALSTAVAQVGLSLVEFTVLDILEEQVDAHLRMQDVACVAALTTGAATRLVGRLESRGLLRRVICASDRRGIYTELTDDGRDLLAAARPVHDAALRTCLEDPATVAAVSSAAAAISRR